MFKKIFLSVIIILVLLPVFPERGTAAERFEEAREKFLKTIEKKEDDNKNETIPSPLKIITDADKEEILEISAPNISYQISGKLLNIVWGKNYDATHYEISEKVVLPSGEESEII
ncbi:MAG: hypothetical protein ABIF17_03025, partial [Patescibacteria group bacterium]